MSENQLTATSAGGAGLQQTPPMDSAGTDIVAASHRATTQVQVAYMMAQSRPRNTLQVRDRVKNACQMPELAEKSEYTIARGGTDITGPTIHLLRAIARECGNLKFGYEETRVAPANGQPGYSHVRIYAIDLETNTESECKIQVKHWRDTRSGGYPLRDERDIYETIANQAARRGRKALEDVLPGGFVDLAVEECRKTLAANLDLTTERIRDMVDKFKSEFKVTKEQLEVRIQRSVDAIKPAQFIALGKVFQSLKERLGKPEEFFPPIEAEQEKPEKPSLDSLASKSTKGKTKEEKSSV